MDAVANNIRAIAERFVSARLAGAVLPGYPGEAPADLVEAYACQDIAINLWPDRVVGWKIGRINAPDDVRFGCDRLAGPIFANSVLPAQAGQATQFPVTVGGFSAVEAEFVFHIRHNAPSAKHHWTQDEAMALVGDVFIGIEIAGSPLATINDLGPLVVASDFGNNAGLILGPKAEGWRDRPVSGWTCETLIDGKSIGVGAASDLPGGPFEAMRFIAEFSARRGRPLEAGWLISTGAVTGVHDIAAGQSARLRFDGFGELACKAVAGGPQA